MWTTSLQACFILNRIRLIFLAALVVLPGLLWAQEISVNEARFHPGDHPDWAAAAYDDSSWQVLSLDKEWDYQGVSNPDNFAWYRIHVRIPLSIKKRLPFPGKILLNLGCIDDCDETWLNGKQIGKTGTLSTDPAGYRTKYDVPRRYLVPVDLIKWDQENVIAVRVYNGGDPGGFYEGPAKIGTPALSDYAGFTVAEEGGLLKVTFASDVKTSGTLLVESKDIYTEKADARHAALQRPRRVWRTPRLPGSLPPGFLGRKAHEICRGRPSGRRGAGSGQGCPERQLRSAGFVSDGIFGHQ